MLDNFKEYFKDYDIKVASKMINDQGEVVVFTREKIANLIVLNKDGSFIDKEKGVYQSQKLYAYSHMQELKVNDTIIFNESTYICTNLNRRREFFKYTFDKTDEKYYEEVV